MELTGLTDASFATFWEHYPRKAGKPKAESAFNRLSKLDKFNAIQGAIYQMQHNPQWRDQTLIPHPSTFINQRRWEDAIALDAKERIIKEQGESPANMVWSAMTQMYGETWIRKFGDSPNPVWRKQLEHISIPRIRRGLARVRDEGLEHPPSLPKFVEMCARTFEELHPPGLPRPRSDEKIAMESIAEMKRILGVL